MQNFRIISQRLKLAIIKPTLDTCSHVLPSIAKGVHREFLRKYFSHPALLDETGK